MSDRWLIGIAIFISIELFNVSIALHKILRILIYQERKKMGSTEEFLDFISQVKGRWWQ